jgi:Fungal specific transcription factor domain
MQQGQVFINRTPINPFVKAVDIFSNVDKRKLPENSDHKSAKLSRAHQNERLEHSIPKSPDPEPVHRMQILSKFIDIYFPTATQGPLRVGQTPASWAHVLPDITLTNSAYNTSLAALCLAQLGIWHHDPVLGKESSRLYSSALGELRKTIGSIGSRKLVAPEATLASIVILSMYEVSFPRG